MDLSKRFYITEGPCEYDGYFIWDRTQGKCVAHRHDLGLARRYVEQANA